MVAKSHNESWQNFEFATKRGLEALGYKVSRDVLLAGTQIDLYAELHEPLHTHRLVVECKDVKAPVGVREVKALGSIVKTLSRANFALSGLVVSSTGFTKEAKSFASADGLWVLTLDELVRLSFDPAPLIETTIRDFEANELGSTFVDLTCRVSEFGAGTIYKPVEKFFDQFFPKTKHAGVAVLGNFGTGKTSLCRHYAYLLAERWKQSRESAFALPVYINLREVDGFDHLEETVYDVVRTTGAAATLAGVKMWLQNGKTLLLLDGFDEMASRMDRLAISANLHALQAFCARYAAQVILTCRTHFFRTCVEEDALGDLVRLYVCDWGHTELVDYVTRARPEKSAAVLEVIEKTYNLTGLARTPLFLNMIVSTVRELGGRVNQAKLYQIYTDTWIDGQSTRSYLPPDDKRRFMEELAYIMLKNGVSHVRYNALPSLIGDFFSLKDYQALQVFDQDVRTCTFLVRDDPGCYHFVHRSYMEFFVASHLAAQVKERKYDRFAKVSFTNEVAGFFANYFEKDMDLLLTLVVRSDNPTIRANAALSLGQLPFTERLENSLLLVLTTEKEDAPRLAIIDALLAYGTPRGIQHVVETARRLTDCVTHCVKGLSRFPDNEDVLHLFRHVLNNCEDASPVIAVLRAISERGLVSLRESVDSFLRKNWWHSEMEIVGGALRVVDAIADTSLARRLEYLDRPIGLFSDRQGPNNENIANPNGPLFVSVCESLTKRFWPHVLDLVRENHSQEMSFPDNEGSVHREFGRFVDNDQLRAAMRSLYRIKEIEQKSKRQNRARASDRRRAEKESV